jgi:hypothetical protein
MTTVNFGVSSNHQTAREESGNPGRQDPRAGGDVVILWSAARQHGRDKQWATRHRAPQPICWRP